MLLVQDVAVGFGTSFLRDTKLIVMSSLHCRFLASLRSSMLTLVVLVIADHKVKMMNFGMSAL